MSWRFAPRGTYSAEHPDGLVSFATAENTLVAQHLEAFTNNLAFPSGVFEYRFSTGGGTLLSHFARHVNENFKPFQPVTAEDVQITASATAAHDLIAWAVGDPGDSILLCKPIYGRLELDFGNKAGINVVYADTTMEDLFQPSVVHECEKAMCKEVRALFIVNPHNPTGRCYPPETLEALMRFCHKHRIHFISDEIYACSVHGSSELPEFTSALSIDTTDMIDPEFVHVVYGLSKDFAAPGLRIGSIITRSNALRKAVRSGQRFMNPSGLSVAVASAVLSDTQWCKSFLTSSRSDINKAYRRVTKQLESMGIRYLEANAGFFIMIDLSSFIDSNGSDANIALARKLLDNGVFLHPNEEHAPKGWFRLVYTQDAKAVDEGLRRMKEALSI